MPAYVDAGDVFAMPCRTRRLGLEVEAWGIVFLEAQACGLPVVIGDSGGAPETLLDPANGTVVQGSAGAVAAAVTRLLDTRPANSRDDRAVPTLRTWTEAGEDLARAVGLGRPSPHSDSSVPSGPRSMFRSAVVSP